MPVYDCRPEPEAGSIRFPCNVKIVDPSTGKKLPGKVFYASTAPARVGRFLIGPDGEPLARATGRRIVRGGRENHKDYERLDIWETRRWIAVSLTTGEVIAKSEGVS